MRLKGKLNAVAAGVLGSFVSRNNDVDGYWALGKLRALCDAHEVSRIAIDLLAGTPSLEDSVSVSVATVYAGTLLRQLECRQVALERARNATLVVDFAPPGTVRIDPDASYGEPFACTVQLEDDRGRRYSKTYAGRCAPHQPGVEARSARAST